MSWISPRIWRSAESKFTEDEPLNSTDVYTPEVLQSICDQGFDAIWMRGRLWDFVRSELYPEINDTKAAERTANLRKVIADGEKIGVKVYLYFNEPLALPRAHEFWKIYPELAGEPCVEASLDWDVLAFCTSTPHFQKFFDESVSNLYADLPGLGGVILITASEFHSHCWSHKALRKIGDVYIDKCVTPMQCHNCKDRQPADVVAELVNVWKTNADRQKQPPQVWAWNWSWSMWYDQPQLEVIEKLPEGVKLMCDFERGGIRTQEIGDVFIDEYSLGYTGPSERFMGSLDGAFRKDISVCAKMQIGTTHELATVPNLPLIPNLFDKLKKIDGLGISGIMGSWNFGNTPSVNTAAFKLFAERDDLRTNKDKFLRTLVATYFGDVNADKVLNAWRKFCDSFAEYPFSIKMLYFGPMNYAVSYSLKLEFEDRPMGPSWRKHDPFGDRLEDCIEPFTLEQACDSFGFMEKYWNEGLCLYQQALKDSQTPNAITELDVATMIGLHISAMKNIFDFHLWRRAKMAAGNLEGSCELEPDGHSDNIIKRHLKTCCSALAIAKKNPQFGYHQEPGEFFYTAETIDKTRLCQSSGINP